MERNFSTGEALSVGWQKLKGNIWFFIKLQIVAVILGLIVALLSAFLIIFVESLSENLVIFIYTIIFMIIILLASFLVAGFFNVYLNVYRNNEARISDLFLQGNTFLRFMAIIFLWLFVFLLGIVIVFFAGKMSIIFGIILGLFMIPAMIWFNITFGFPIILIIDKDMKIIESLRESKEMTKGHKWHLFGFNCLVLFFLIMGEMIAYLISIPFYILSFFIFALIMGSLESVGALIFIVFIVLIISLIQLIINTSVTSFMALSSLNVYDRLLITENKEKVE